MLHTNPLGTAKSRAFVATLDVIPVTRHAAARSESPPRFHPSRNTHAHTRLARPGGMRHFRGMSTLAEIEEVVPQLSAEELVELERFVRKARRGKDRGTGVSVFDLPPLDLGRMLRPLGDREEWYDEMLEGRV